MFVDEIHDQLARGGEEVAGQPVDRCSANERMRPRTGLLQEHVQPGRLGEAVVVGEGDELASGFPHTPVA